MSVAALLNRYAPAVCLGTAVAAAGYRRRALSRSGAVGAAVVGAITHSAGSWRWSAPLLAFFAGSSALSRLERGSTGGQAIAAMTERGSRRDLAQVLANGGVGAFAALWRIAAPHPRWASAFAGAYAAANSDTWATEIGALSPTAPRMIFSGREVQPGTSGAVTPTGLAGAVAGSALIGVVAGCTLEGPYPLRRAAAITIAGMAGSLADSVAGATIQAGYRCPRCREATERHMHRCGTATILVRGHAWCSNEVVNALCTAVGAGIALLLTSPPIPRPLDPAPTKAALVVPCSSPHHRSPDRSRPSATTRPQSGDQLWRPTHRARRGGQQPPAATSWA
ncbi:MAG TPA: DUF92 domain-containing protein [Chloroflexota bacterium]|nr:DUF92 domain-containing protein [Chloroflexota bacterium]